MAELIKKITAKAVAGAVEKPKKVVQLVRVAGIANKAKVGSTDYGEYVAFLGSFKAINLATGEEFRSGKLILPEVAQNVLAGMLEGEGADSVGFAFDLGVKPSKSPTGYDWTATPLVEADEADPVEQLMGAVNTQHALPAPAKSE